MKLIFAALARRVTSAVAMTVVCAVAAVLSACGGGKGAVLPPREVATVAVARGPIELRLLFTGNIVAKDAFEIFPRASGKVAKKLLKEGDPVRRGEPILLVERDEVGFHFRQMPVVSLADGVVGTILADVGTAVDPSRSVASVVRPGVMRVKLDIPERYLEAIRPGTAVSLRVDSLSGASYEGAISSKSPVVNEKTRTANVEAELANEDGRLRHGMFGRMDLVVERHEDALLLPADAISWEGDRHFVYRIAEDALRRVEVRTGLRSDGQVEILQGAAEGELVARGNLLDLKDGERVVVATSSPSPQRGETAP